MLRVDLPPDGPDRAWPALDPDHDALRTAAVVASVHDPFGEAPGSCRGLHNPRLYSGRGGTRRRDPGRVLVPLYPFTGRGADRAIHHPRAPSRPAAGRDPER